MHWTPYDVNMDRERLRKQIAHNAARLLYEGRCDDPIDARRQASRQFVKGWTPAAAMPGLDEILKSAADLECRDVVELPEPYGCYRQLLAPLAHVRMPRESHPEGDALYHSLQTYVAVADALPYDIEAMTAALLHEVGRAVDRYDPAAASRELLDGLITDRIGWFLSELPEERRRLDGELGIRAARRLRDHEDGEALTTLALCDRAAVVCGAPVPELTDALADLAALDDDVWTDEDWNSEQASEETE